MRTYKKQSFQDPLEWLYRTKYKCYPFDMVSSLVSKGVNKEQAFYIVQVQMNEVWEECRKVKRQERKQAVFHPVAEEETPFCFTEKDREILHNQYMVMEERPDFSDLDIREEQLCLDFL